ncbi:MAG: hypothetical protein Q8L75_06980 [Acidobacteriota bacterium]|nr:hypothetical protein [Acidobacteriota bacterium]
MSRPSRWALALLLNLSLAAAIQALAPDQPRLSDRQEYDYVGEHGLAANCPMSVYCYRVLVPGMLTRIPVDPDVRWRVYQLVGNTVAGILVAAIASRVSSAWAAPAIASILTQTSFGFAFTAYDPYTADPLVFVISATLALCWLANRPAFAFAAGLVGVFAKETVALTSAATALAALGARDRPGWPAWVVQGGIVGAVLFAFHWIMDTYYGWDMSGNAASQFSKGSWLALWWSSNPGLLRKGFFLFAPFGFAWFYAAAGVRDAPLTLRQLTLGALLPFLALNYVQNPERALANTFFVIIPLATVTLLRVPVGLALTAALTNGLLTAKVGSSSIWLPSAAYLAAPAAAAAVGVFWFLWAERRTAP